MPGGMKRKIESELEKKSKIIQPGEGNQRNLAR